MRSPHITTGEQPLLSAIGESPCIQKNNNKLNKFLNTFGKQKVKLFNSKMRCVPGHLSLLGYLLQQNRKGEAEESPAGVLSSSS